MAIVAIWPIGEDAAAPESGPDQVADQVGPAVVTIRTTSAPAQQAAGNGESLVPEGVPEEFRPFFRRFFGGDLEQFPRQMPRMPQTQGMGSGVIIDSSGLILTNNHVVGGGARVLVRLNDGREFEAVEVKTDPKTDVAILWIEGAGDLPVARLGDSDSRTCTTVADEPDASPAAAVLVAPSGSVPGAGEVLSMASP